MENNEYSNEYENMDRNEMEHFEIEEEHMENVGLDGNYFEFLYNLKDENPWEESDFNSIFMYL